ncbi:MAG: COX15/CtaA family protein [Burkholderiales bacterium]|nr:COX15/CtaA family protein [Burkholderiales bacterium]
MNATPALVDFAPALRMALLVGALALLPLGWLALRWRGADGRQRLAALTALALFLTFDLVVFGAFTRLTDSGLGCPDWPGCYAQASPLGARGDIAQAQATVPGGPVSWHKAWIEMIHRYLAMTVGLLIVVLTLASWWLRWRGRSAPGRLRPGASPPTLPLSPLWPTATALWVVVQGLFGKYTVTLKLYPAVVTAHLMGGLVLLALLAVQHAAFAARPLVLAPVWRRGAVAVLALLAVQVFLGGWVSTNYAVLACTGFPKCNGHWWPPTDFGQAFSLLRALGHTADGAGFPFDALVTIHMTHRLFAIAVALAAGTLAWGLLRQPDPGVRRLGRWLALLIAAQIGTGLSNVVLGWPLPAALGHTAGAAALVLALTLLLARSAAPRRRPMPRATAVPA